jgi:hypothetical protein
VTYHEQCEAEYIAGFARSQDAAAKLWNSNSQQDVYRQRLATMMYRSSPMSKMTGSWSMSTTWTSLTAASMPGAATIADALAALENALVRVAS